MAENLSYLSPEDQKKALSALTDKEMAALEWDWKFWGRTNQHAPKGKWSVWLILAGRGFGKTRSGAEWVRDMVCGKTPLAPGKYRHIALVAETAADARDVLVGEGKDSRTASGLLQVCPKDFRPVYEVSKRRLTWPNGAIATTYNGTEPDQLRGPQHDGAWCDELAKWQYAQDAWDMLQFGMRVGTDPRICVTTTPRPIKLLKAIMSDPDTIITRGSTLENASNLPAKYLAGLRRKYEGTRLGRQELLAEILDDTPGSLWTREMLDIALRPVKLPYDYSRVVVAVDPAVSNDEDSDETGIIVAAIGRAEGSDETHGYILEDASGRYTPSEMAKVAIRLYRHYRADSVIGEANNGGDFIETTLRVVDSNVSYKKVIATRGKAVRAQPISALYERGIIHHAGSFPKLEDQMSEFTSDFDRSSAGYSPDRVDALVWGLTELMVEEDEAELWKRAFPL